MTDLPSTRRVDYRWKWEAPVAASGRGAEDCLRAAWEGGPPLLTWLLPVGWRFGLGLRLGPRHSKAHVLGWPIVRADAHSITVAADSPFMNAENSIGLQNETIVWTTSITFTNRAGRVLWLVAKPVHQWLVPRALAPAIRRRHQ